MTTTRPNPPTELEFLRGSGEMAARIRAFDWSSTPLGAPEQWPQSLRSAVSFLLPSKAQIVLFWGADFVTLYNDAYRPVFGTKHPAALGLPARDAWSEIWESTLRGLFEGVVETGEAFWAKDRPFVLERLGFPEETFFDVSYDPVRDESGGVGGVFCIVTETTRDVISERRMRMLRDLAARNASARSPQDACVLSLDAFRGNGHDIPFALIYLTGQDGTPSLACATPGTAAFEDAAQWPIAAALRDNRMQKTPVDHTIGSVPQGEWPVATTEAMVVPLATTGSGRAGVMVIGLNPFRPLDEDYRTFLELIAAQVSSGIANGVAHEQERQRTAALASLDRAKTAFFSNVSHEFRTPLTLMLGPVEDGLADTQSPLPAAQRERFELVRRSGQRLQKLVNTLLDFSRIEAGRAQASYQATDLASLTVDLASSFRSAIERGGLDLIVDCPSLDQPVYVDRDMWEKIVLNLISNAFKFTFVGAITVRLRCVDDQVELTVQDTGTGIPASELPHVFERFRRVEGAKSRTHEGTGIGLALVQELVKLHGGSVSVTSAEAEGSTFTVRLPLGTTHLPNERIDGARTLSSTAVGAAPYVEEALRWLPDAATVETAPLADSFPAEPAPAVPGRRERIVWADDNADMREYVRRLLTPRYEVETFADGVAALAAIRARRPDLVLCDVMMPRLDGLGLVRALRASPDTRTIPVILLSARAGEESRIEGLDAGADDYLHKPFGARELLAHVAARLDQVRTRETIRRSEERYRNIFQTAGVSIWEEDFSAVKAALDTLLATGVTDLRGYLLAHPEFVRRAVALVKILDVNQATLRMFGARYKSELMESLHRVFVPESEKVFLEELIAIAERRTEFESEIVLATLAGERRDALVNIAFPRGESSYDRVLVTVMDITDRKRAEQALREEDRRKDEFLATLSHELRNPLAPLRNSLHLLRIAGQGQGSPAAIHDMMERQVDHLVRLVDDLLEMSRISRGTLELRKQRVDVAAIVRNAVETSQPLIQAGDHRLSIVLPETPLWVEGDAVRLSQILANLLNNAAKYTPHGGAIAVEAQREALSAVITVSDNGVGIPPEALPRMFEMFTRGEFTADEHGHGGLGIGLALARRLAEMHGGGITAHSDGINRGSRFTVRLPLAADQRAATATTLEPQAGIGQQRILVVDDNRDAAESLSMILQFLGADVRTARNGAEALAVVGPYDPSVILLDIGMPGMDGYEVARRIRQDFPTRRPAIVALTGWGQEDDRRKAREAGFDHHLIKPADISVLRALLATTAQ